MQPGDMVMPALWWVQFYEIVEEPSSGGINLDGGWRWHADVSHDNNIWLLIDEKYISSEYWARVLLPTGEMLWARRRELVIFDENNVPSL